MAKLTITTKDRGTETKTYGTAAEALQAAYRAENRKEVVSTKVTTR